MATTKIFEATTSIFEIAPKNFFVFFFNRKMIFVLKQTFSEKKNFCVYNVVLDILILDFFPFLLITFFKIA